MIASYLYWFPCQNIIGDQKPIALAADDLGILEVKNALSFELFAHFCLYGLQNFSLRFFHYFYGLILIHCCVQFLIIRDIKT
jgi:hypothetical protein